MTWSIVLFIITIIAMMLYIRFAPSSVAKWHVAPNIATSSGKPNEYQLVGNKAVTFDLSASNLSKIVHEYVENQPNITKLEETPEKGLLTFIQRSKIMGYPDYITISILPISENQAQLEILSRSRFGYSDLGTNRKRVDMWVMGITRLVLG